MGEATSNTFDYIVRFIDEKHSEMYMNTLKRASQTKNVQDDKNNFKHLTCLDVESCGV